MFFCNTILVSLTNGFCWMFCMCVWVNENAFLCLSLFFSLNISFSLINISYTLNWIFASLSVLSFDANSFGFSHFYMCFVNFWNSSHLRSQMYQYQLIWFIHGVPIIDGVCWVLDLQLSSLFAIIKCYYCYFNKM